MLYLNHHMASITQDMRYRLSLIKYTEKYGVTNAAIKYKTNRQYIYRWRRRFDGSIKSLRDRSRRLHHHPKPHTPEEIKLITDMRRRNSDAGLVVFGVKITQRGYSISIPRLYRFLRKQSIMVVKLANPKYVVNSYEQMQYPGHHIQIDLKFVPSVCLVNDAKGKRFYQYTTIDEYSRWRFVEVLEEHCSYSSLFLEHLIKAFPCPIECVQTNNGQEFAKRFNSYGGSDKPTIFQVHLMEHGIKYKLIRSFTPRHNCKVERSHKKYNERFYATHLFYSFEDFAKQLKVYNRRDYNNFPMRPLGLKLPNEIPQKYLRSM